MRTMSGLILTIFLLTSLHINAQSRSQTLNLIPAAAGAEIINIAGSTPIISDLLIFSDQRLAIVYPIIQRFKSLITSDPYNVTASWTGPNICRYKRFYCEAPPYNRSAIALASIDFNGFQLSATTFEGFLDLLPDIALFHANSNYLSGTISSDIVKLPYLYELDLSNNRFSGPFPSSILGMESLSFLDMRFNSFSGPIPPELFDKDLDFLFLNNNNFMTRIPDNVRVNDTHVMYLTLANNKFFGPIPGSIFARALSGLSEVLLLNNMLTGCLPYELGFLKEAVVFDASHNNLTGSLPLSLGCLENLEVLNLAGNMFYGTVPEIVCRLGKLVNLSLSNNYFTDIGPSCSKLVRNGVLDLRRNCVQGLPFQRSMAECAGSFARSTRYCPKMGNYSTIPCWIPKFDNNSSAGSAPELAPMPS